MTTRTLLTTTVVAATDGGDLVAVQNALVQVYETGTTTPASGMYAAASGGSPIASVVTDSHGVVTAWFDVSRVVDLRVSDNSHTAVRVGAIGTPAVFDAYTAPVAIPGAVAGWPTIQTSTDLTITGNQVVVEVDATAGAVTITAGASAGVFVVKKMDATTNQVIIKALSGATDGGPSVFLDGYAQARMFAPSGINLDIIGERKPFGSPVALDGPSADGTDGFQARSGHKHSIYVPSTPIAAMGAAQAIHGGAKDTVLIDGILNSATCAITVDGFPAAPNHGLIILRLHQDGTGGRKFTLTNATVSGTAAIFWAEKYAPVMPQGPNQVLEVTLWSTDGGLTVFGSSGQPVRYHRLNLSGALTDGYVSKIPERIDNDFRIVDVWTTMGDAPASTQGVYDVNLGTFGGAVASVYTTTANRPKVAAAAHYGSAVLPDVVDGAAGQYLTAGVITASSSGYGQIVVKTIEVQ